jgi:hypothetical protein
MLDVALVGGGKYTAGHVCIGSVGAEGNVPQLTTRWDGWL